MLNRKNEELTQDDSVALGLSNNNHTYSNNNNAYSSAGRTYVPPHLRKNNITNNNIPVRRNNGRWNEEQDEPRRKSSPPPRGGRSIDDVNGIERRSSFDNDHLTDNYRDGKNVTTKRGNNRWKDDYEDDRRSPLNGDRRGEEEIFRQTAPAGINFDKYDALPVEVSGLDCPEPLSSFQDCNLGSILNRNLELSGFEKVIFLRNQKKESE